ncbi:MAG: hypothetical protein WDZ79_00875, partial [Candidatus Paceibacterota bacterium]
MNFQELFKHARRMEHAVRINTILPLRTRLFLSRIFLLLIVGGLLLVTFSISTGMFDLVRLVGATLLLTGCWLVLFALDAYVFSYTFRELTGAPAVTIELSSVVLFSDRYDLTAGFLVSPHGGRVWQRLGLTHADIESFYADRHETISTVRTGKTRTVDIAAYAHALYDADDDLRAFLFTRGVTDEVFAGAVEWVQAE